MKAKSSMMANLRAHEVKEVKGTGMDSAAAPMAPRIGVDS